MAMNGSGRVEISLAFKGHSEIFYANKRTKSGVSVLGV